MTAGLHRNIVRIKAVALTAERESRVRRWCHSFTICNGWEAVAEVRPTADVDVMIFSLPYFISKWEAHKGRGQGDFRTSKDFEDLVYVFEHAGDLANQLAGAPVTVRSYLQQELLPLLENSDFEGGLYCHMESGYYGSSAAILEKLRKGLCD